MLQNHMKALKSLEGKKVEAGWFESARYPSEAESSERKEAKANLEMGKTAGIKGKDMKALKDAVASSSSKATGRSIAANARVQEFGAVIKRGNTTITIPARPFMRLAWTQFNQNRGEIQAKVAGKMVRGELNPDQGLGAIGLALEGSIVRAIRNGKWAPNAPSTVAAKGFDKPLINTALMWQSVSSKVS